MNAIENSVEDQAISKVSNNAHAPMDSEMLLPETIPLADQLQIKETKLSTVHSNEDKDSDAKDNSNETALALDQNANLIDNQSQLLKKKRTRTPKEMLLDVDYLKSILFPKEDNRSKTIQNQLPKTHPSNTQSTPRRQETQRRKQKLTYSTKQCHICNCKSSFTELKTCSIKSCSLLFCFNCLIKYKETEDTQLENSIYNNNWKCLKCRNKCKCHRCRVTHRKGDKAIIDLIMTPKEPICLKEIIKVSDIVNDPMRQMNNIIINDFAICEMQNDVGDEEEIGEYYYCDYGYNGSEVNNEDSRALTNREIEKLKDIHQSCEVYNIRKFAFMIEKEKNGNSGNGGKYLSCCIRCFVNDCNPNELLCFLNKKDLLFYLKYCCVYQKELLRVNYKVFDKNKRDVMRINQSSFLSKWKFFYPKVICKVCFMYMMNMDNMVESIKMIFNDDNVLIPNIGGALVVELASPLDVMMSGVEKDDEGNKNKEKGHIEEKRVKRKYTKRKGLGLGLINGNQNNNINTNNNANANLSNNGINIETKKGKYNPNVTIADNNQFRLIIEKKILNCSIDKELALINNNSNNNNNKKNGKQSLTKNGYNTYKKKKLESLQYHNQQQQKETNIFLKNNIHIIESKLADGEQSKDKDKDQQQQRKSNQLNPQPEEEPTSLSSTFITNSDGIDFYTFLVQINLQISSFKAFIEKAKHQTFIPLNGYSYELEILFRSFYTELNQLQINIAEHQTKALNMKNILINDLAFYKKFPNQTKKMIHQLNEIDTVSSLNLKEASEYMAMINELYIQYQRTFQANNWIYYLSQLNHFNR